MLQGKGEVEGCVQMCVYLRNDVDKTVGHI